MMSNVAAMAKPPSAKASSRLVGTRGTVVGG
jgi:hypothetical protein